MREDWKLNNDRTYSRKSVSSWDLVFGQFHDRRSFGRDEDAETLLHCWWSLSCKLSSHSWRSSCWMTWPALSSVSFDAFMVSSRWRRLSFSSVYSRCELQLTAASVDPKIERRVAPPPPYTWVAATPMLNVFAFFLASSSTTNSYMTLWTKVKGTTRCQRCLIVCNLGDVALSCQWIGKSTQAYNGPPLLAIWWLQTVFIRHVDVSWSAKLSGHRQLGTNFNFTKKYFFLHCTFPFFSLLCWSFNFFRLFQSYYFDSSIKLM